MSYLRNLLRLWVYNIKEAYQTAQLERDTRAVKEDRLTHLSSTKLRRIENALAAIERDQIPGAILEFGVALGGSAIVLAKYASPERQFHGFDVFGMIPPPRSEKDDDRSRQRFEVIQSGAARGFADGDDYYGYRVNLYDDVKATMARYGTPVDGIKVQLHKGLFEDTWPQQNIKLVSLAHVDCDWYDPVSYCLNILADRMSPGGVMIIDDYFEYGGARTAVDEFMRARSDFSFQPGQNPILRKR